MKHLETITDAIRLDFESKNEARDKALAESRILIRHCASTIRAVHRKAWDEADSGLETIRVAGKALTDGLEGYPGLFNAGYTQDALKELVEAFVTYALVRGEPLPTPDELNVPGSTYLNGMAEAASELRRSILDIIRQGHSDEAERLLDQMDQIYNVLMAFNFADAITGGLRRRVDSLRGVLERTRGDLTNSLRQQRLQAAMSQLEERLAKMDS